ncbi:hypothetical protein B9J93_12660 [Vibrio sp. V17_P4S1T151]|uniref:hypothetical protein n=1 Tax=unclassified Vibrio TaxID=2614977 RepID=UPI000B8E9191|nr:MULTISPECIES: hypothetical protein [unclassified Vibrio]OXX44823.1 hypothetical protein B9J93_12660 [Vibrio sp. V17_P4S1T151]OXX65032.1 hypothetical protein B9J89_03890 [Vibrio sp. V15_P4S5T153]
MAVTQNESIKYTLSFQEALEQVMDGKGWAQGEQFANGVIMMEKSAMFIDGRDYLHVHDFKSERRNQKSDIQITKNLMMQKFRIVSTQADAERKIS